MNGGELAALCSDALERTVQRGDARAATVMLTTPKGWRAPAGFPRGALACVTPAGKSVWYFPAEKVGRWLLAHARLEP